MNPTSHGHQKRKPRARPGGVSPRHTVMGVKELMEVVRELGIPCRIHGVAACEECEKLLEEETMDPLFEVHKLNEKGLEKARLLAEHFDILLSFLRPECLPAGATDSRYFALVKTHLEEACFYAKKAIATVPENQQ
jgi:hypothetical protein